MGKNLKYSLVVLLALTMSVMAATAGKLKGVVTDEYGEPLAGANITIEGSTLGAESDEEGYYYIIGVRAGSYKVICQFMGYSPSEQTVKIRTGLTSKLNFKLYPMDFELEEVVFAVEATDNVQKDVTTSRRTISTEAMELDVVTDADDVVAKQAGVKTDANGFMHFRGGRAGEVNYQVDGISISDPTAATRTNQTDVDAANIEEITVMKGVPTANYGNALSGSVNIVLKVGDQEKTRGRVKYTTDSFLGDDVTTNYDKGEFSLSGPVPFTGLKIKPTYFLSVSMDSQDGVNSYKTANGDFFERDDYDITGFGFDLAQRRLNEFNITAKLAYDFTDKIKVTTSYTGSRSNNQNYEHDYKYHPEGGQVTEEDIDIFTVNFKQVLNQQSYYELIFSYFQKEMETMQGGKRPDDFPFENENDAFSDNDDINGNNIHDGGNGEGFIDENQNAKFDREYFVDRTDLDNPIAGKYQDGEYFYDENQNGKWDGDVLYDSNSNNKWDYWDGNASYHGFNVENGQVVTLIDGKGNSLPNQTVNVNGLSIADDLYFEGFVDSDNNGKYIENQFPTSRDDEAEPFRDGDFFVDAGEPFVDQVRWAQKGTVGSEFWMPASNGEYDGATTASINVPEADQIAYDELHGPGAFVAQIEANGGETSLAGGLWITNYEAEKFVDLPSSYGRSGVAPSYNGEYDAPNNGVFDEFEAYATKRNYGTTSGTSLTLTESNGAYRLVGTTVTYEIPAVFMENPVNFTELRDRDAYERNSSNAYGQYATWIDYNDDDSVDGDAGEGFNPANGSWEQGEWFADYNRNGKWNKKDEFWNPGKFDQWASYWSRSIKIAKLKGDYSNQIDKNHLIQAGFEFVYNDLDYFYMSYPDARYTGLADDGPYSDRGTFRTYYHYKPIELGLYLMDKLEFEDLVVNAGLRMDLLRHDSEAEDFYNERRDLGRLGYEKEFQKNNVTISPRIGISHSIDETSKLYFSYGHLYQLTNYTNYYTPDTQGSNAISRIGNMNLDPEKTVLYELGVSKELGEYMVEVTGYFKDNYDLINTKKYYDGAESADFYYNSDYGKTRGIELNVDKQLSSHYSWSMAYELSYSFGKASSSTSNYFDAIDGVDIDVKEFPLDWDERHSLTANASLVYGKGEKLFDVAGLDNWSLTLSTTYGSGKPFTPTPEYYNSEKSESEILTNDERMPWTETTDLKFSKSFDFESSEKVSYGKLKFEFTVNNLFNHLNVINVNDKTATTSSNGTWDSGPKNEEWNEDTAENWADPENHGAKRTFRFSVGYSW